MKRKLIIIAVFALFSLSMCNSKTVDSNANSKPGAAGLWGLTDSVKMKELLGLPSPAGDYKEYCMVISREGATAQIQFLNDTTTYQVEIVPAEDPFRYDFVSKDSKRTARFTRLPGEGNYYLNFDDSVPFNPDAGHENFDYDGMFIDPDATLEDCIAFLNESYQE